MPTRRTTSGCSPAPSGIDRTAPGPSSTPTAPPRRTRRHPEIGSMGKGPGMPCSSGLATYREGARNLSRRQACKLIYRGLSPGTPVQPPPSRAILLALHPAVADRVPGGGTARLSFHPACYRTLRLYMQSLAALNLVYRSQSPSVGQLPRCWQSAVADILLHYTAARVCTAQHMF